MRRERGSDCWTSRKLRAAVAFVPVTPLFLGLALRAASAQPSPAAGPAASTASPSSAPAPSAAPSGAASAVSARDKAFAAAKYEQAAALARQGQWKAAHPLFLEAWGRFKHWQIALNLGRTEIEIGKFHAAEGHLSFALTSAELPAGDRPEVTRLIQLAKSKQGAIHLVATAPREARVWVDDQRIGVTPFSGVLSADPGDHRIEIRLDSARKARMVTVATGQTRDVDIDLRPVDLVVAPSSPPTTSGEAPPAVEAAPSAPASSPAKIALVSTGAGLSLTALATGVGLSVVCGETRASVEKAPFCNGATASFVIGAVLTGGTVFAFFALPDRRDQKKAELRLEWTGLGARAELRW